MTSITAHPILTCESSMQLEEALLAGDSDSTREAMECAGRGIGRAVLNDYLEYAPLPGTPRILVLAGKGHNGGDAMIAAETIRQHHQTAQITLLLSNRESELRPLVSEVYERLKDSAVAVYCAEENAWQNDILGHVPFNVCLDGWLGMQFRPPLRENMAGWLRSLNEDASIDLRAAVDLPSGLAQGVDEMAFRADFTYAAGIPKKPLFEAQAQSWVGRVRYVDIGFFDVSPDTNYRGGESADSSPPPPGNPYWLGASSLKAWSDWRPVHRDKRHYGKVGILAGSESMPGAALMSALAALHAGAGLVTVFVPRSIHAALAARAPEAMWVPLDADDGSDPMRQLQTIQTYLDRLDLLLMGPGLGRSETTQMILCELIRLANTRLVLDADALTPLAIDAMQKRRSEESITLTPHHGELLRLLKEGRGGQATSSTQKIEDDLLIEKAQQWGCQLLLKGPITRITNGEKLVYDCSGSPVLARGGSGDILSGMLAASLAPPRESEFDALCLGSLWHGLAAERLARTRGQRAVRTTELLDYLAPVLRDFQVSPQNPWYLRNRKKII